jgi:hypothetical protein
MEATTHSMGSDLQQTIQKKMDTLLGIRPCEVVIEAFTGNSKAVLEVMEAAVVTFEEISDKMEAGDLEETSEITEAVRKRNPY